VAAAPARRWRRLGSMQVLFTAISSQDLAKR
jgi:hypothetical protein